MPKILGTLMIVDLVCKDCNVEFTRHVRWRIAPVSEWSVFPPNDPPPPDSTVGTWGDLLTCTNIEAIDQEELTQTIDKQIKEKPLCDGCLKKTRKKGQAKARAWARDRAQNSSSPEERNFANILLNGPNHGRK